MRHGDYLTALLRPLGVYDLDGGAGRAELDSAGAALDGCAGALETVQREMLVATAEGEGLELVEALLSRRPVAADLAHRRAALAALLRVGGDSFTLAAINDNLTGCGLNTVVSEGGTGTVVVRFPQVPGIPAGFEDMRGIIEDILPCHLDIVYDFWYVTWALLEGKFPTWGDLEARGFTWTELETDVY